MTDGLCVATETLCEFAILTECEENGSTGKPEGSSVGRERPEKQCHM